MEYHGITMMGDFETDNVIAKDADGIKFYDDNDTLSFRVIDGGYIAAFTGAAINEFSIDSTFGDQSNNAIPTEKAVYDFLANNYQPYSIYLTQITGLTPTSCYFIGGNGSEWEAKTPTEVRACLELGTAALRPAEDTLTNSGNLPDGAAIIAYCNDNYLQESNNLSDLTDPSDGRTNLGVAIGSDVQAWNTNLDVISGLSPTSDTFIIGNGSNWAARTPAQARTSLELDTDTITTHYHDSRYYQQSEFTDGTTISARINRLKVMGETQASGYFYAGSTDDPSSNTRVNYDGHFYATKVFNAVYNDLADFQPLDDDLVYGKCYYETKTGLKVCNDNCQKAVAGIASDTFGYGLGQKSDSNQAPIAVAGWVLAFVDREYEIGTPLTSNKNGDLTEMHIEEKRLWPERIVATYSKKEESDIWNGIKVNGRHWVKVK
jgi:hypothetical protein